jgi:hypothetical protein
MLADGGGVGTGGGDSPHAVSANAIARIALVLRIGDARGIASS